MPSKALFALVSISLIFVPVGSATAPSADHIAAYRPAQHHVAAITTDGAVSIKSSSTLDLDQVKPELTTELTATVSSSESRGRNASAADTAAALAEVGGSRELMRRVQATHAHGIEEESSDEDKTALSHHEGMQQPAHHNDAASALPVGSTLSVHSAKCGHDKSHYLPQSRCCDGNGCCPDGVSHIVAGGYRPWDASTDMVIVVPQMTNFDDARTGGSKEAMRTGYKWIKEQTQFPYVLCPYCAIEVDPVCSVPTHQGFESSVFLSFIVNNYDRLPRTVAFLHGHPNVQGRKDCNNIDRLEQLLPTVNESTFVFISEMGFTASDGSQAAKKWRAVGAAGADEIPPSYFFTQGPHFVAGRDRIRSRPLALWKDMLAFASGQNDYPGSDFWVDKKGFSQAPGHLAAGGWQLEVWWNLLFNIQDSHRNPDFDPNSLRCKMKWCEQSGAQC